MSTRRLDTGGLIDRSQPITFTWDGKKRTGYSGDTLASALIATVTVLLAEALNITDHAA